MQQGQSLYILQAELIDKKVEVSVNNNIVAITNTLAELREQIINLRQEMRQEIGSLRNEMNQKFFEFGIRLTAVETALSLRREKQVEDPESFFRLWI